MSCLYREAVQFLRYEPDTGRLFWSGYPTNTQPHLIGREAGCRKTSGYLSFFFKGRPLLVHRAAWLLAHGSLPAQLDHINGDRIDNRLVNLRPATVSENNRNRGRQSNNTTGFKGVTFHKGTGKFHAKIMRDKRRFSLGYFPTAEEASMAYQTAAKELHGEFARI